MDEVKTTNENMEEMANEKNQVNESNTGYSTDETEGHENLSSVKTTIGILGVGALVAGGVLLARKLGKASHKIISEMKEKHNTESKKIHTFDHNKSDSEE